MRGRIPRKALSDARLPSVTVRTGKKGFILKNVLFTLKDCFCWVSRRFKLTGQREDRLVTSVGVKINGVHAQRSEEIRALLKLEDTE